MKRPARCPAIGCRMPTKALGGCTCAQYLCSALHPGRYFCSWDPPKGRRNKRCETFNQSYCSSALAIGPETCNVIRRCRPCLAPAWIRRPHDCATAQLVLQGQQAPERHPHVPLRVTRLAVQRKVDAAHHLLRQPVIECLVADGGDEDLMQQQRAAFRELQAAQVRSTSTCIGLDVDKARYEYVLVCRSEGGQKPSLGDPVPRQRKRLIDRTRTSYTTGIVSSITRSNIERRRIRRCLSPAASTGITAAS